MKKHSSALRCVQRALLPDKPVVVLSVALALEG